MSHVDKGSARPNQQGQIDWGVGASKHAYARRRDDENGDDDGAKTVTTRARIAKPWEALTPDAARRVGGYLGVYELADGSGTVVRIGYAGGASRFGLGGVLGDHAARGDGALFRYEITMAYVSRYRELLMVHLADHGRLPVANPDEVGRVGRLRPS